MRRREEREAREAEEARRQASNPPVSQQPVYAPIPPPGYSLVPTPPPRKRGLRKFSWVIIAVNIIFLIWVIVGATGSKATDCGTLDAATCQSAADVGTGIGVALIIVFWVIVDVILLVLWLVTRPKQR